MNTNEILNDIKYWGDYDGSIRLVRSCFVGDHIEIHPIGSIIGIEDKWGVWRIVLTDGDDVPVMGDFADICSQHDHIAIVGEVSNAFLPVYNVFISDSALCTLDGKLGEEVVVFELG